MSEYETAASEYVAKWKALKAKYPEGGELFQSESENLLVAIVDGDLAVLEALLNMIQ